MAYCTQDDILEQIPEEELLGLTDDDNLGQIDTGRVERAIADADAEIDSYCGGRYTAPFAPVPTVIRKISVEMAVYNLYARRVRTLPEERKDRYKDIIRFLRDVANGVVALGADALAAETAGGGPAATKSRDDRIFTMDTLGNY